MSTDWDEIRNARSTRVRPDDWPEGVYAISMDTVSLIGVHEQDNKLYWDGREIVTKSIVRLGNLELWLASLATIATVGMFVLSLGSTFLWWGN